MGQWTAVDALEQAIPLTLIGEAVNARFLSALKSERERAAQAFPSTPQAWDWDPSQPWVEFVQDALYAAKLVSYAQGFMLLRAASERFGWKLAYGDIALLWRGGCIIRSRFLGDIKRAFDRAPALENLMFDDFFAAAIRQAEAGWRRAVALGIQLGIPLPGFSSALAFRRSHMRSGNLKCVLFPVLYVFGAYGVFLLLWRSNSGPFKEYSSEATLPDALLYATGYCTAHLVLIIPMFVYYWNRALTTLLGLPRIRYWQASALFLLSLFRI